MKLDFLFLLELAKHGLLVGKDSVPQINSFAKEHGFKVDKRINEDMLRAFFYDNGDTEVASYINTLLAQAIFNGTQGRLTPANAREWKRKLKAPAAK